MRYLQTEAMEARRVSWGARGAGEKAGDRERAELEEEEKSSLAKTSPTQNKKTA